MASSYDSYPILEFNIFGACFCGCGLILTILIFWHTRCFKCNYVWTLTYVTMLTYTGAQAASIANYVFRCLHNNQFHLFIYCSTFFLNFISLFLVLIVFVSRINILFQGTSLKYPKRFMFTIYVIIATVPLSSMTTLGFLIYANAVGIEPGTGSTIYIIIYTVIGYHLAAYTVLAILLLSLFINRLIQMNNAEFAADCTDYGRLKSLQLKLTVLGIICIGSTVVIGVINYAISECLHFTISDFWISLTIDIDCIIGFICTAFTLKSNDNLYRNGCHLCQNCFVCIVFGQSEETQHHHSLSNAAIDRECYTKIKREDGAESDADVEEGNIIVPVSALCCDS
eukprot:38858_1